VAELNVTAFPDPSGSSGERGILGERYEDAAGNLYNALAIQPMIVLRRDRDLIKDDLPSRDGTPRTALPLYRGYVQHRSRCANRATVRQYRPAVIARPSRAICSLILPFRRGSRAVARQACIVAPLVILSTVFLSSRNASRRRFIDLGTVLPHGRTVGGIRDRC